MKRQPQAGFLNVCPLEKEMKLTDDGGIISDLNSDVWSHVIEYLQVGEVIMLSLVNHSIHQIISDHIRIIHPYCLEDEWSISRALLDHRSVSITKDNIERIQHIVNQLIENNEPITKFTKRLILYGEKYVDFEEVFKVLSTPTRQSTSNTAIPTHTNRPIVSGLEKLKITQMYDLSSSVLFQLLPQCHNLRHLVIDNYNECSYDYDIDSISYPELSSLKTIKILSRLKNEVLLTLKILEMAPNLEHLTFKYYYNALEGSFLESLAKLCPKLKSIRLERSLHFGNYITDDALFKFLQNKPHLEYVYIDGCVYINGSIYSKMGQFKQLKYFNVERKCYFDYEDVIDQCDEEPFTGDGVLPHLQYLNIGDEMKGDNVDHLLKMAPNVRDVGYTLYNSTSNYLDLVEKLVNQLTTIPYIKLDDESEIIFMQQWLEKTTILEILKLYSNHLSKIDFTKLKPIPSVKKLKLGLSGLSYDLLKEISRVFPHVEVFKNYGTMKPEDAFIELIKEGKWPNLRQVIQMNSDCRDELRKYRPHLTF